MQLVSIERRNFVGSELERAAEEATQEAETADRGEVFRACPKSICIAICRARYNPQIFTASQAERLEQELQKKDQSLKQLVSGRHWLRAP